MKTNVESSETSVIRRKRAALKVLKETTDLVLADLDKDSIFFNENPPQHLPEFDKTGEWRYHLQYCTLDQYHRRILVRSNLSSFGHRSRVGNDARRRRIRCRP